MTAWGRARRDAGEVRAQDVDDTGEVVMPRKAGYLALGMYRGSDPKPRCYVSFRTSGRSKSGAGISLISSDSGRSSLIFSSWGTTREFQELPIEA